MNNYIVTSILTGCNKEMYNSSQIFNSVPLTYIIITKH